MRCLKVVGKEYGTRIKDIFNELLVIPNLEILEIDFPYYHVSLDKLKHLYKALYKCLEKKNFCISLKVIKLRINLRANEIGDNLDKAHIYNEKINEEMMSRDRTLTLIMSFIDNLY